MAKQKYMPPCSEIIILQPETPLLDGSTKIKIDDGIDVNNSDKSSHYEWQEGGNSFWDED